MKTKRIIYVLCVILLTLSSCMSNKQKLNNLGLLGEQRIIQMDQSSGLNGKISGNFFGFSGVIDNKPSINFWWSSKKGIFFSSLPKEKIFVIIDEKNTYPTIEFIFKKSWLHSFLKENEDKKKEYLDFNKFINSLNFEIAIVRISSKDLSKEPYLPKI